MTADLMTLSSAALLIGFVHCVCGPDHYIPFVAMSRVGVWSLRKTLLVTVICGIGHVLGSAALDMCYVACGRFDAFWEENLNPWDTAAGFRIALEAGARATDFENRPFTLERKSLLVTNGHIHDEMLSLLATGDDKNKK